MREIENIKITVSSDSQISEVLIDGEQVNLNELEITFENNEYQIFADLNTLRIRREEGLNHSIRNERFVPNNQRE